MCSHQGEYYCAWGKLSEYLYNVLVKHPNMLANWGWLLGAWFVLTIESNTFASINSGVIFSKMTFTKRLDSNKC